jgi:hypothetical protein
MERAKLVKKNIMLSWVFSRTRQGKMGAQLQGEEWEDQILSLVGYSLDGLRVHAGAKMKGGGGRL